MVIAHDYRWITEIFEGLGFEMTASLESVRHELLKPVGLRLGDRATQKEDTQSPWVEGDSFLVWDDYETVELLPADTRDCLWDFITVEHSPEAIAEFTGKWGLLLSPDPDDDTSGGWLHLDQWRRDANVARSLVITIAAAEAGEAVNDEILLPLVETEFEQEVQPDGYVQVRGPGVDELHLATDVLAGLRETRRRMWAELRRSGGAPLQQAGVAANRLSEWCSHLWTELVWDENGRRVETIATGVREVVASHLYSIFVSGQMDLFVCSVCGRPYLFDDAAAERRPRRGMNRFCSESCRLEARKQANRQSWHKNRDKWRPRKPRKEESTDEPARQR